MFYLVPSRKKKMEITGQEFQESSLKGADSVDTYPFLPYALSHLPAKLQTWWQVLWLVRIKRHKDGSLRS